MAKHEGLVGARTKKTPQGGRPSKEGAEQITAHILETALALFTRQGYGATSIDQVAAECQSSKHTLYRRYKSKAELFAAVMDMARGRVFKIVLEPRQADRNAITALKRGCGQILDRISEEEYIDFYRVCLAEGRNFPEIASKVITGPNPVIEGVEYLVVKAQEQGALKQGDSQHIAHQLLDLVATVPTLRLLLQSEAFSTQAKRRQYLDKTWELFIEGARSREGDADHASGGGTFSAPNMVEKSATPSF